MYTLVDFITQVKGVEYILSILAICGFIVFWEILKPKPFKTVVETGKDDLCYIDQAGGFRHILKSIGKIVAAPFIGLAYIVMLPLGFFAVLAVALVNLAMKGMANLIGTNATFAWRPMEAYLSGKKNNKEKADAKNKKEESKMS
jgi:hypothetical protein